MGTVDDIFPYPQQLNEVKGQGTSAKQHSLKFCEILLCVFEDDKPFDFDMLKNSCFIVMVKLILISFCTNV